MRPIRSLIKSNDTVWFYCRNKELAKQFLEQCETEGFWTLNNQKPTTLFQHKLYGVFDNLTMGYLSNMIWCLTFQHGNDDHLRVDYEKYISDTEDYICHETNIRHLNYSDWNLIAYSGGLKHKEFYSICEHFIVEQTYEEYCAFIYRYLIESSWHYTPEEAAKRIEWEEYYILHCYFNKCPVSECAVEVGYGCG